MVRRQIQTILVPIGLIGGYVLFSGDGFLADIWDEFLGPFLFTYWVGLGFLITWDVLRDSLHKDKASPKAMALWGAGLALFLLMMLGGPAVLLDDPWLFGATVAPGIELAKPWLAARNRSVSQDESISG